jgi:hypothetical protein
VLEVVKEVAEVDSNHYMSVFGLCRGIKDLDFVPGAAGISG